MPQLQVVYEDNHLLVVNKPAPLATQGALAGEESLVTQAKEYLKHKYNKPGNVFVGVVSRLDASVTGLVALARTSKGAARLAAQFQAGTVTKIYWAAVAGKPEPPSGKLVDFVAKFDTEHRMRIVAAKAPDAQEARLAFHTIGNWAAGAVLEIQLETGRKHQIRLQLAERGHPISGDRKYGSNLRFGPGIALHSRRLEFDHPVQSTRLSFDAPLPASWQTLRATIF